MLGLTAGFFLIVLGLTGSLIAFEGDIPRWLHRDLFYVRPASGSWSERELVRVVENRFAPARVQSGQILGRDNLARVFQLPGGVSVFVNQYRRHDPRKRAGGIPKRAGPGLHPSDPSASRAGACRDEKGRGVGQGGGELCRPDPGAPRADRPAAVLAHATLNREMERLLVPSVLRPASRDRRVCVAVPHACGGHRRPHRLRLGREGHLRAGRIRTTRRAGGATLDTGWRDRRGHDRSGDRDRSRDDAGWRRDGLLSPAQQHRRVDRPGPSAGRAPP